MKQFQRVGVTALILTFISLLMVHTTGTPARAASTVQFWLQTMDSCRQAIPGANFVLRGHGLKIHEGPGPGTKPMGVGQGNCPLQRGNCQKVPVGCLSWNIPIPTSGTLTYKIKETSAPANYVPCDGGSVCPKGPETITLTIDSTGAVSATVRNIYPDKTSVTYPTSGAPYTGTTTDPAIVHNFALGNISCDGNTDADDHLSGGISTHCDSDSDLPQTKILYAL